MTNEHRNAIEALDYECEIDVGHGYLKLERFYGNYGKEFPPSAKGRIWVKPNQQEISFHMADVKKHILFTKAQPIKYGQTLRGFVMFSSDWNLLRKDIGKISRVRFTVIDAFQKRHKFEGTEEQFLNAALFYELLELSR